MDTDTCLLLTAGSFDLKSMWVNWRINRKKTQKKSQNYALNSAQGKTRGTKTYKEKTESAKIKI